ncbi:MAG: oligosaccharide flippase family protein [Pirellulales bacterium]
MLTKTRRENTSNLPITGKTSPSDNDVAARFGLRWLWQTIWESRRQHAVVLSTIVTSFIEFGLRTVHSILIARILGPVGRGEYATVVFYMQSLAYAGLLGSHYAITRHAARHPDDAATLRPTATRVAMLTGFGSFVVVAMLSLLILPMDKRFLVPLCIICGLTLPSEHMRILLLSVDQGCRDFFQHNANRIFAAVVFPALILLVWALGIGTVAVITTMTVIVPLLALVFRSVTTRQRLFVGPAKPSTRQIIKQGLPYSFAELSGTLFDRLHIFLVLCLASLTMQGYYTAALPVSSLLMVAPFALTMFTFNSGADPKRPVTLRDVWLVGGGVLLFQGVTTVILLSILQPLIIILLGSDFAPSIQLARVLIVATAIAGCGQIAEGYLRGRRKSSLGIWARCFGAVTLLIFVAFAYGPLGTDCIPIAALIGYLASTSWIMAAVIHDVHTQTSQASIGMSTAAREDDR